MEVEGFGWRWSKGAHFRLSDKALGCQEKVRCAVHLKVAERVDPLGPSTQGKNTFFKFIKYFIYLFLKKREGGREEEGEKHQCAVASGTPPTGDLAHNPGMCPDWESNWQPFGLQAGAQSTEQYPPGPHSFLFLIILYLYEIMGVN